MLFWISLSAYCIAQTATQAEPESFTEIPQAEDSDEFSRQDRLRGSITPERAWWDLQHYHLSIEVFPDTKTIKGTNEITFAVLEPAERMQIDLQLPLVITGIKFGEQHLDFECEENVYWISFAQPLKPGSEYKIAIDYEGTPVESRNPPWEGGFTWTKDDHDFPFIATSCQGIGASIWWPCKDHGYDEPDRGMEISVTVPEDLVAVSNGRLREQATDVESGTATFHWIVTQPINNYCINVNIGNYVNFSETYDGEAGPLDLDYWVLDHQRETAEAHFKEAPRTIAAFEYWFGPYPFYEDSYKLVVVPYLGMEHQSSVTYGNGFRNGYRGTDLSGTGVGMKFDFIIVHESGHEWFGNNVSMKDVADMWIHESFTNYSESLFVEHHFTREEAADYVIGCRKLVANNAPIIGTYGVHNEGSGDMYYKGGNMLHTIRHIINDDEKWRTILRGINSDFYHQTVDSAQIENYISENSGIDLTEFFDQYLRTTKIPVLRYSVGENTVTYRWDNVVEGFHFPVKIRLNGVEIWITPTQDDQSLTAEEAITSFELDRNFYMNVVAENRTER